MMIADYRTRLRRPVQSTRNVPHENTASTAAIARDPRGTYRAKFRGARFGSGLYNGYFAQKNGVDPLGLVKWDWKTLPVKIDNSVGFGWSDFDFDLRCRCENACMTCEFTAWSRIIMQYTPEDRRWLDKEFGPREDENIGIGKMEAYEAWKMGSSIGIYFAIYIHERAHQNYFLTWYNSRFLQVLKWENEVYVDNAQCKAYARVYPIMMENDKKNMITWQWEQVHWMGTDTMVMPPFGNVPESDDTVEYIQL